MISTEFVDVVVDLCGRYLKLFDLSVQDVDVGVENRDVVCVLVDFRDEFQ